MKHLFITLMLCAAFVSQTFAAVWYVKTNGNDANAGNTWGTAFQTIQKAINTAAVNDEIWVAQGVYYPTTKINGTTERHRSFLFEKDVLVYGGFVGTETMLNQRDWLTNYTALSGDIGEVNNIVDNTYHVVWIEGRSSAMLLDGFTITKGKGDDNADINNRGIGVYNNGEHQVSNPTFSHCKITDNEGGDYAVGVAMFNNGNYGKASPTLTDCTISYNLSYYLVAGIYNSGYRGIASPKLTNCNITGNKSYGASNGSGISNFAYGIEGNSSPELNNCTIANNTAGLRGGGICSKTENDGTSTPILTNCTFSDNDAPNATGGAIYHFGQTITLTNCTFTNNTAPETGGVHIQKGNLVATDCYFSGNNSSNGNAGAVYILNIIPNGITNFTTCTFINNHATKNGGAVYINTDDNTALDLNFDQCSFSGNTAKNGAGICIDGVPNSTLTLAVNNCLFFNNSVTERGGAFCTNQNPTYGSRSIDFCTFYNNTATLSGGAIGTGNDFSGALSPSMRSCIAWGNSSTFGRSASGKGDLSIQNSIIQEPTCPAGAACSLVKYNQDPLFVDPLFLNVAFGNFALMACSPAIDAGLGGSNEDFIGTPRPQGVHWDMGAYEFVGVPNTLQAVCNNITVDLNDAGYVNVLANSINNGSTGCSALSFKINDQASQTYYCNQIGNQTATLKVSDLMGHTATCVATVTVRDAAAPNMLCKPVTLNLNAAGQAILTVAQVDNGSYDNCAIQAKSLSQTIFSCAQVGLNTVILNGNDASNNKGQCTAIVTVKDVTAPVAKCKNITANLAANGTVTLDPIVVDNGSTDNCSFSRSLSPYSFNCGNVGVNNVTLKVTDISGNLSTCAATVTVKDVTAPNALCKNATVILNDAGQGTLVINQINNGSSDACGIATMTLSKTQFNCSEIPGGVQSVTLTLKDVNNNQSSCTAQVTVKDNLAPTAICQNTTVKLGANGMVTVYPADLAANSYDNCSVTSYSPVAKVYTTTNLGNNNLNITVKDWSNNGATCTSVVTVQAYNGIKGGNDRAEEKASTLTESFDFNVYPNPTTGEATIAIELTQNQSLSLQVFDLTGRMVIHQQFEGVSGSNQIPVNLGSMANGVYLLEIQTESARGQKRLVLQSN